MSKFICLLLLFVVLFSACDESNTSIYALSEDEFTTEMEDSLKLYIEQDGSGIKLEGKLELIDGKCQVWLTHPVYDPSFIHDTLYTYDTIFTEENLIDSLVVIDTIYKIDTVLIAETVYSETFIATDKFTIDEEFERLEGEWVFRYKIEKLNDDFDPEGSLEFKLFYND